MISVFEPSLGEEEIQAVVDALKAGEISGSFGKRIPEFEKRFADYCGSPHGVAVSSGTTALEIAVNVAGVGAGDEVLISANTNIATALAVYRNSGTIVSVDSESDTWNLDLRILESLITPKTKAIIPVHIYGHPIDMDELMKIAGKHNLIVIEDCAEAHGAEVRGRRVGSFGQMAAFSFYANKIITTGEGGMVLTSDEKFDKLLRSRRNLGFGQPRFLHSEAGYNFRMTGMQAALGLAQLKKIETFINQRRALAALYNKYLAEIDEIQTPAEKPWAKNVYWMYSVVFKPRAGQARDGLLRYLLENGIDTRTMFCPMNLQPFLKEHTSSKQPPCPVAENLWVNGFYLPSSHLVSENDVKHIAMLIKGYISKNK
jgi:perosamine synthetase